MTDKTEEKPQLTIKAKISLPDVWTVRHYGIYQEGRRKYETPLMAAKTAIVPAISRYHGCLALIDAGVIHNIPPELMAAMNSRPIDDLPLALVGTIVKLIGLPLEDALDTDFLG